MVIWRVIAGLLESWVVTSGLIAEAMVVIVHNVLTHATIGRRRHFSATYEADTDRKPIRGLGDGTAPA